MTKNNTRTQIYDESNAADVLGRTHITGYEGWPPPEKVYRHLKIFADFINSRLPSGSLLDLGCGDGALARLIAEKNPRRRVVAVDLEPHPQWRIKKPANLTFKTSSVYDLPFKAGEFDIVILKDVLHHLPDPEYAMSKLTPLAKKSVLVVEANRYNPVSYLRMVKIAKHEHFSRRKLRRVVGPRAKIYTIENHVWPHGLGAIGYIVDLLFGTPFLKYMRNYNLALIVPGKK